MVRVTHPFWKYPHILIFITVFYSVLLVPAWAQIGTAIASGQTVTIDAHGECRLVTNSDAGTRMVFTGTAPEWQSFRDNPNGLGMEACAVGGVCEHDTWAERESGRKWFGAASSADGSKLAAVVYGGQIYTSTDKGVTWIARENNRKWIDVASSANGQKLVAVSEGGQIYTSTDSGLTWTAREGNRNWNGVASSSDGSKLVASVSGGQIYTSTDSGLTWTARDSNRNWLGIASSADGNKLAGVVGGGRIYTSTDGGLTWTARENNRGWHGVASSADGNKLVAVVGSVLGSGQIYISSDGGVTWSAVESSRKWFGVASSADGNKLAAVVSGGKIYTSTDGGLTWAARENNRNWNGVTSSSDGNTVVALVGGVTVAGKVYISSCQASGGAGVEVGGFQWYQGARGESCTSVCAAHGGVNMAGTRDYAGSGGSLSSCRAVATALGVSSPVDSYSTSNAWQCGGSSGGVGCIISYFTTGGYTNDHEVVHCSGPATSASVLPISYSNQPYVWAPDTLTGYDVRVCACNGDTPPADCTAPWGGAVAHGDSITAYQAASVPNGSSCVSETRTCADGVLSGTYTNQNCSVQPPASATWKKGVVTACITTVPSDQCPSQTPEGTACSPVGATCGLLYTICGPEGDFQLQMYDCLN